MTNPLEILAEGFRYPAPGRLTELRKMAGRLDGAIGAAFERFLDAVADLTLGEWEELHTRTLDLAPVLTPYVGHVIYGEDYRRGSLMAALNRAMTEARVDKDGELPDHLVPVLRYLAVTTEPIGELTEILPRAVDRMVRDLHDADPKNPYRHLIEAVRVARPEAATAVGGSR